MPEADTFRIFLTTPMRTPMIPSENATRSYKKSQHQHRKGGDPAHEKKEKKRKTKVFKKKHDWLNNLAGVVGNALPRNRSSTGM